LSRRLSEFLGVVLFATALFWMIALATYDPADPVWFFNTGGQEPPANFAGRVGAFLAELSYQVIGFTAYLLPVVLVTLGWHSFWCRRIDALYTKVTGLVLTVGCTASFLSLAFDVGAPPARTFRTGGYIGGWLGALLSEYLNRTGSIIVILTLLFLALILTTQLSFGRLFSATGAVVAQSYARLTRSLRDWWTDRRRERERRGVLKKHLDRTGASSARTEVLAKAAPTSQERKRARARRPAAATPTPAIKATQPESLPLPLAEPATKTPAERRQGAFTLPPLSLLDPPRERYKFDERELMDNARLLEDKCREFSVEGAVVQIHPGPVVTTFEFKPDAGVKYGKVTGLADDLCLAMQAEAVLIERLPGKSTVGIQIPNRVREQISLRQMLESTPYRQSSSKLTLALGRTIHGEPVTDDLATMPHLLIAGSTGTGKSVAMNAMLTSILYRATPAEARLILIDPKRLELGMYEDIPHLLTPVVVEPKLAANALRWAVREMEERYKRLAAEGVRNLDQYNRNIRRQLQEAPKKRKARDAAGESVDDTLTTLPSIILAIDELADLMMIAGNEVEESIARLAQMARAVGIHLILATQRPSVDVITGLIKANLPSRIAFRVSSKVDSRTILDANGAEQLLGRGDMLYLPPASSRLVRIHGPYISEQETARLCGFLRKQGSPAYDQAITAEEKQADAVAFEKDDLYDEASRLVVAAGQASISYLQRRLRIGFSRAARLVDMMEADGLVSAGTGGKAREVLVTPDYFEQVDLQLR
jgi:S-DNA-T family DNA segregation ATPase FtsK/SpoIIIE